MKISEMGSTLVSFWNNIANSNFVIARFYCSKTVENQLLIAKRLQFLKFSHLAVNIWIAPCLETAGKIILRVQKAHFPINDSHKG